MIWNQSTAEACARVMGLHATTNASGFPAWTTGNGSGCFQISPHADDGDSRRLEVACMKWLAKNECSDEIVALNDEIGHAMVKGSLQDIRDAVIALAVAIDAAGR